MSATKGEHQQIFDGPFCDGLSSLTSAANDLKSPLSLIRQLSLTLDDSSLSLDEQKRIFRQISITSERALNLTKDLTKSINLSDGLFELEPINPWQVCEDVINEYGPIYAEYNRNLKLVTKKHPLLLVGNRDLLRRILANFSDNALHYTEKGRVAEIKISASKKGDFVRLAVRDYGPVMSSSAMLKLIDKRVKDIPISYLRPKNNSLNMYIANQFASAMNGRIGASRHRDGMTFYVDLQVSTQLNLL